MELNRRHVLAAAAAASASRIAAEAREPAQPVGGGRFVTIDGGRRIYLNCRGQGAPTVVFEATGGSASVNDMPIQRRVAAFARACVYDRAGLGQSDPAPPGRSFEERAGDLHAALRAAGERGPYVLVGGSFGGLLTRVYAQFYPREVVGMVLVDAAEEGTWFTWMATAKDENRRILLANAEQARSGAMRRTLETLLARPTWFTPEEKGVLIEDESRPEFWQAAADEIAAYDRTPENRRVAGAFGSLGDQPLVVLSHGKPSLDASLEPDWPEGQARLASLSTNSVHVVVRNSGHTIGLENPPVVAAAVHAVMESVRSGQPIDGTALEAMAAK